MQFIQAGKMVRNINRAPKASELSDEMQRARTFIFLRVIDNGGM